MFPKSHVTFFTNLKKLRPIICIMYIFELKMYPRPLLSTLAAVSVTKFTNIYYIAKTTQ